MFSRRKEELGILQKSLESLENSQKNTELMVNTFCQMIKKEKEESRIVQEENSEINDEEKRRAAYALNLCTVSVSQIVEYDDENILEQEYETILNNLNLENMPKDEALLNIIKQILDTVTFFRIQEGDKAFIEKEYQHKMKNAIWSGIPNFGLIVAGGNPFTMAVSLASQIGIGYMNYRKAKAENDLDKEKQEWQLQRAAIEQLNGLRRELFDASWRLADRYGFKDEYRLTEKQITQYNKILMDADDIRRYERLEAISDYFIAYPSFWYYYGHAANSIAQNARSEGNTDVYCQYRELALEHFDNYLQSNKYALLREDQITSSCALEYIDLLDVETDKQRIKELVDCAIKMSGRECDILQLCAISYLRIGEIGQAVNLLRYLVNEKYNTITNAQLLSTIYVGRIIEANEVKYSVDYKILAKKVPLQLLFPIPEKAETIDELKKEFIQRQQEVLYRRYAYVIRSYYEKATISFNKAIPVPFEDKRYLDAFFSDQYDRREERLNQYKTLFSNKNKADEYLFRLSNSNYSLAYLDVFNEMMNAFESIIPGNTDERQKTIQQLADYIEKKILDKRDTLNNLQERMNSNFGWKEFEILFKLSFDVFTKDFFENLIYVIKQYISSLNNMEQFSMEETMLREFCVKQGIPEFEIILNLQNQGFDEFTGERVYFSSDLLGGQAFERSEMLNNARRMAKQVDESIAQIILDYGKKKQSIHIYTKWNKTTKGDFEEYFKKGKKKYFLTNKEYREKIFAVLIDDSFAKMDLVFTVDGIICDKTFTGFSDSPTVVEYGVVTDDNNRLNFGEDSYKSKDIDMVALFDLIQDLAEMVSSVDNSDNMNDRYLSDNSVTAGMIENTQHTDY